MHEKKISQYLCSETNYPPAYDRGYVIMPDNCWKVNLQEKKLEA